MPRGSHSIHVAASANSVFTLLHDYSKRLQWDSMLSEARLLDGATEAKLEARSRCVGNAKCLWLPIEATYIAFEHGKLAAVKMDNRPWFFDEFAATIRHQDLEDGGSKVTYIYHFKSKPRRLAFLIEPIMSLVLNQEVRHRLKCLKRFSENGLS